MQANIIERMKNITLRPQSEWPVIAGEPSSVRSLYTTYAAPLAAIPAISMFIGFSIVGMTVPLYGTYRTPLVSGLIESVVGYAVALAAIFLMAAVVNILAPSFGGRRDLKAALKLVAYSSTPTFVCGLLSLFPPLMKLETLASLWAAYLFYVGVPFTMQVPPSQSMRYAALSMTAAVAITVVLAATFGTLLTATRVAIGDLG